MPCLCTCLTRNVVWTWWGTITFHNRRRAGDLQTNRLPRHFRCMVFPDHTISLIIRYIELFVLENASIILTRFCSKVFTSWVRNSGCTDKCFSAFMDDYAYEHCSVCTHWCWKIKWKLAVRRKQWPAYWLDLKHAKHYWYAHFLLISVNKPPMTWKKI